MTPFPSNQTIRRQKFPCNIENEDNLLGIIEKSNIIDNWLPTWVSFYHINIAKFDAFAIFSCKFMQRILEYEHSFTVQNGIMLLSEMKIPEHNVQ